MEDIKVEQVYFPLEAGLASLGWAMVLWQDVLGRTGLSVEDNFFEVGGDSLAAVSILTGAPETDMTQLPKISPQEPSSGRPAFCPVQIQTNR